MLEEILQELEDTIKVTMDCYLRPEGQMCRVRYLSRRTAHDKIEAMKYLDCTAVVIELPVKIL
jgi:hypothetical protein